MTFITKAKQLLKKSMSNLNPKIEVAKRIAIEAHKGQKDKAGVDYYSGHLCSVANGCSEELEKVVGYLHDVAEDTNLTEQGVCEMLRESSMFSENEIEIIEVALTILNQKNFRSRKEYIDAIKGNELAKAVKKSDLQNNMNLNRLASVTEKDIERTEKYKKEYNFLNDIM